MANLDHRAYQSLYLHLEGRITMRKIMISVHMSDVRNSIVGVLLFFSHASEILRNVDQHFWGLLAKPSQIKHIFQLCKK
jgi:hypothetical protein